MWFEDWIFIRMFVVSLFWTSLNSSSKSVDGRLKADALRSSKYFDLAIMHLPQDLTKVKRNTRVTVSE